MSVTPDSEEFLQGVRDFVGPYTGQFNYSDMLVAFSDKTRFYTQGCLINQYHQIQDAVILSSGCGFGGTLVAYCDLGARLAVGVEVDSQYIRLAGIRVRGFPDAAMVHYDGDHLPFADGTFDIVDSVQVLEHVDDPKLYLDEICRVMKPRAICYIEFPNRLFPFEQHCNVPLVNWLPKPMGDALASWLSQLPFLTPQQASRLEVIKTISRRYISLLTLLRLLGTDRIVIHYLGSPRPLFKHLGRVSVLKFVLPNRTIRAILEKVG
jgi:SAM-dependent methyltransferase